jgi:hypothetical protein
MKPEPWCLMCDKTPDYLVAFGCLNRMEVDIFGYCGVHFHESLTSIKNQETLCWCDGNGTHPYDDVLIHGLISGKFLWPLMYMSIREEKWIDEKTLAG